MAALTVLLPLIAILVVSMPTQGTAHSLGLTCTSAQQGDVRYNLLLPGVEYCDGEQWRPAGQSHNHPTPSSCNEILLNGDSHGDGFYPLATSDGTHYLAYCDMTCAGGGWTLFATKASTSFQFFRNTFNVDSASATDHDAAGCIPTGEFNEVMFKFRNSDSCCPSIVYNKNLGAASAGKTNLNNALQCGVSSTDQIQDTDGFYRRSPSYNRCVRDPTSNFHSIPRLHTYAAGVAGLSEVHTGTDQWIDMWHTPESPPHAYSAHDTPTSRGAKCIAGHCLGAEPIYVMYR